MSKSHVEELSAVYIALFEDIKHCYPALVDGLDASLARLLRSVESRGVHLYCVDLPALGKHFDRCLSQGQFSSAFLPFAGCRLMQHPIFLGELYELVFDDRGCLRSDADTDAIFFIRQVLYMAKKTELECSPEDVHKTYVTFYEEDLLLPEPDKFWSEATFAKEQADLAFRGFGKCERYLSAAASTALAGSEQRFFEILDKVVGIVSHSLGPYSPDEFDFRHGPGAISEVSGPTNKYCWRNWSPRLESRYPIADYGFYSYSSWASTIEKARISSREPTSRLIDVPKTLTKPRLIAAEPSEHQWCQQNIWHYFCRRTSETWISEFVRFRDQTRNQELALRGSLDGTLCTVDLSSASDRVSCLVVGQTFRGNLGLLSALQATRTQYVSQGRFEDLPQIYRLRKFSTMGSACTFPVESLIFMSVAIASVLFQRRMRVTLANIRALSDEVAVFGDDIVVPSDSRVPLISALESLDFKVNDDKSYHEGNFRESCGVDAFRGCKITPVYWHGLWMRDVASTSSTIEVANNFQKKFLINTANRVSRPIRFLPCVGFDATVCARKVFFRPCSLRYKTRWNKNLQRTEFLSFSPRVRNAKQPYTDDSAVFQYFIERPSPFQKWTGGTPRRPSIREKSRLLGWVPLQDANAQ